MDENLMKRLFGVAIAAVTAGAGGALYGCAADETPTTVYGPPEDFDVQEQQADDNGQSADDNQDNYDPSGEEQVDVYGPPADEIDADDEADDDNYDASAERQVLMYGPPAE